MVRLLRTGDVKCPQCGGVFQSHNGAIAAFTLTGGVAFSPRFNPTMVRLLLGTVIAQCIAADCFNPTMVRLLPIAAFAEHF